MPEVSMNLKKEMGPRGAASLPPETNARRRPGAFRREPLWGGRGIPQIGSCSRAALSARIEPRRGDWLL